MPVLSFKTHEIQLNLSTTATLEAEESGRCIKRGGHSGEVLIKSQCMDFLSTATKKSSCCAEVAVRGGSTDDQALPTHCIKQSHFYCIFYIMSKHVIRN